MLNISFSGELAYEIHVPNASLHAAYLALRQAGETHGLQLFGARAVESMRMEKGFLHWKADLLTEFDPFETGLDRFVKLEKGDFIGRDALLAHHANGPRKKLVSLSINSTTTPAHGGASLMSGSKVVGTITSGDWGHRTGLNLAYGFVEPEFSAPGDQMQLDLCGQMIDVEVIMNSPYDPEFLRMQG